MTISLLFRAARYVKFACLVRPHTCIFQGTVNHLKSRFARATVSALKEVFGFDRVLAVAVFVSFAFLSADVVLDFARFR